MTSQQGLAGAGRDTVGPLVLSAWDDFIALAEQADLQAPSRLPGWRGQEVCVHLGLWDDHRALEGLVASAQEGGAGPQPDADAANDAVTASHRDAGPEDVLAALRRHRDAVAEHLGIADPALDLAMTASTVGRLPLLSVVLGQAYELAVHGLDLAPCGAPAPSDQTLDAGLAALAEVTGAIAAQAGVTGGATLHTPDGGWRFSADRGGWTVERTGPERPDGSAVEGTAATLLDASAGRANPVGLLARRRIKAHHLGGLLALAPVVEHAPNVPGGPILRLAARSMSGPGRLLRR
jgi:uncharacterized protein (TIGR03083 family)